MAVAADERTVKADLAHIKSRDSGKLRREEILLGDAVHIIERGEHRELDPVLALACIGNGADEQLQPLAGNALGHRLFHLLLRKMRQQISDDKARLVRFSADADIHDCAVLKHGDAVQLERDSDPLVFLYPAVVVRAEIAELVRLIHRVLFEVDARRVNMGTGDDRAVGQTVLADNGEDKRLAAVAVIDLRAGAQLHAGVELDKSVLLRHSDRVRDSLALGAGIVQKLHVAAAVVLNGDMLGGIYQVVAVLRLIKKLAFDFIHC